MRARGFILFIFFFSIRIIIIIIFNRFDICLTCACIIYNTYIPYTLDVGEDAAFRVDLTAPQLDHRR